MSFESITNRGEFFSNHYLDAVIGGDIGDLRKSWDEAEERENMGARAQSARAAMRRMGPRFFTARAAAVEASPSNRPSAMAHLHDIVLEGLGFIPQREELEFKRNTVDVVTMPVATRVETGAGLLLVAVEAGMADSVDDLFDAQTDVLEHPPAALLDPGFREGDKHSITRAPEAVNELFNVDEPPRFVLVVAGRIVLLAERAKWSEGRFLAVDLDAALERNDTKKAGELETIAALFSADALVPGGMTAVSGSATTGDDAPGDSGAGAAQSVLDELVDKSHKHAVGVSKELRIGIRESIEILANEVIHLRDERARSRNEKLFTRTDVDARDLTRQCLRYLYRLLVLLYAESRPELGILPTDDPAYMEGYSLDRLRELCLVELETDHDRHGTHLSQSLTKLFALVNDGRHVGAGIQQSMNVDANVGADDGEDTRSEELYLQFPGLDAQLFDPVSTALINQVELRNEALQQVLRKLMLAPGKRRNDAAGFISYAQLGINQLGAVYEGLMAYTGFYAHTDLYEVAKGGDPADGTWMVPVVDAAEYPEEVFVRRTDPLTGRDERVLHRTGGFVFRLAGRDRQRSASYYTPEVLTRCVVRHALAELLGLDDYAPEGGSAQLGSAVEILDLTICEPALGSGAFLNEAINQLAAEYLRQRQAELGERLDAERYNAELQKVKAYLALNQAYGVDLNATAIELAEVSLWLNAMHPGLKAPWFGLQLRHGNSLIGCRRATWKVAQLRHRPWAQTKKDKLQPPTDRALAEALVLDGDDGEIHHFLLPGHGWAAVADRKEAKELRPDEVDRLKTWRKTVLAAPDKAWRNRLLALSKAVEESWAVAAEQVRRNQRALRREIGVYGFDGDPDRVGAIPRGRADVAAALVDPDLTLGRLRTLMDAWVGLWFWPLDTGVAPPSWEHWVEVAEALIRPEAALPEAGQLDLFDDLSVLDEADARAWEGRATVAELRERHRWLDVALRAAKAEGAFHWELEFAPIFQRGGFDLQVGNPPWVRPRWYEDLVLAEHDPWWGVTAKAPAKVQKARRADNLADDRQAAAYLTELAAGEGVVEILGSPVFRALLAGVQTNLYMLFMDTVWRHAADRGTSGLLHPESHFTDPKAANLRRATYSHLRRHWQFVNESGLFEDIHNMVIYGIHCYGTAKAVAFHQASSLLYPETLDRSLVHDGRGRSPSIQRAAGGWDMRPHRARVLTIDEEVLADWARLFDEPGTPAAEARLLRPVTTADLEALSVLADQPVRLADHDYYWTRGHEEDRAKTDGTIRWETAIPGSWDEVILQGPHFTVATPFNKQPNEKCKNNRDYSDWDLESLPEHVIPRTNYQRACDLETYNSRLDHWNGTPFNSHWRLVWRRMTQPGLERSLQAAIVPPGPTNVDAVLSLSHDSIRQLAATASFFNVLPVDYLVKVLGKDVRFDVANQIPLGPENSPLESPMLVRTSRLNCLIRDYAPLWEELYDSAWQQDAWTDPVLSDRIALGDVGPQWTMNTPLRRDRERWQALVELDALAALLLGLTAEQLCAMYRTQFAVLRKYEYKMRFDAEGRKICGYHQSAGYRQSMLQDQAKAGDLPTEWKRIWDLVEQHELELETTGESTVDWLGLYTPPFTPANRELAMTTAYHEFARRSSEPQ